MEKTCQCLSHVGNRCYRCTYGPLMERLETGPAPMDRKAWAEREKRHEEMRQALAQSKTEEMRQELDNARCVVSILVRKAGGHMRITQKDISECPEHVRLLTGTDVETGDYILSVIEPRG